MQYVQKNVEVLWPRINRTYRFDQTENRSVACGPLEEGASYDLQFKVTKDGAEELLGHMRDAWKKFKAEHPEAEFKNKPYDEDENGMLVFKTKLKGAYSGEKTRPPAVYDENNQKIKDDDFELTTGSICNIAVTIVAYSTKIASGVSLRLKAVQVLKLSEDAGMSPFGEVKNEFTEDEFEDVPFMNPYKGREYIV